MVELKRKLKLSASLFPAIYLPLIWLYVNSGNLPHSTSDIWRMAVTGALLAFVVAYSITTYVIDLKK